MNKRYLQNIYLTPSYKILKHSGNSEWPPWLLGGTFVKIISKYGYVMTYLVP